MRMATDGQMDYVMVLHDKIKNRDASDLAFYEVIQRVRGRRSTVDMTFDEAHSAIDALKDELGWR